MNFNENFSTYDLKLHGVRLPEFEIDGSYKEKVGLSRVAKNFDFLKSLCHFNFKEKGLDKVANSAVYQKRMDYELDILNELEFIDYILLVWDVINFCKESGIATGIGRGSAAGSLVLYLIGVTGVDPIKYDLYFERFISKTRAKKTVVEGVTYLDGSLMPDVDIDICYYNRHKVLEYLEKRFPNKTCKISTLNTLSGKLLIKECGKIVGGFSEDEVKEVSDLIPKVFGKVDDISDAYNEVPAFKTWCDKNTEVYKIALKLRDLIKNKSVHPSATLLSYFPLDGICPVETSSSKERVCSFDMKWSSITFVKLDLLGLRSVSVIDDVCRSLNLKYSELDLTDVFIYQNLQDLKSPHGLFQIEADSTYKALQKIKPKNLDELSGVMAIARPGAMQFIDPYAKFTNTGTTQSIHPFFDDILGKTGGICLFQEQMMKMVHKIGFSLEDAEIVRRVVGKKLTKEMPVWEQKIKDKIQEKGLDPKIGEVLWKIMDASKDYSFNASHSLAYASLCAATIYLKFRYPAQFFLSLLKMTRHEPNPIEEISIIQKELSDFNIKLLPPHLLKSELDFAIEENDIRFGLLSIKGISDKTIEKLQKFKSAYSNKFEVFQAAEEANLNIGILSALIQAGALPDIFGQTRSRVVLEAQLWNILLVKEKQYAFKFAEQFKYNLLDIVKHLTTVKDDKGKPIIKESRFATIKKNYAPYKDIYLANRQHEAFANWFYERQLLGYTYDTTLKTIFADKNPDIVYIKDVKKGFNDSEYYIAGVVSDAKLGTSKNNNKYFRLTVSDETGDMTILMFNSKFGQRIDECKNLNGSLPKEENIVIVRGKKKEDCMFADLISIQDKKIFTRLKDLKKDRKEKEEKEVDKKEKVDTI
jgi:DNA polymerase-3 subunit alpha